jgi:hypothetical protein
LPDPGGVNYLFIACSAGAKGGILIPAGAQAGKVVQISHIAGLQVRLFLPKQSGGEVPRGLINASRIFLSTNCYYHEKDAHFERMI